MPDNPVVIIADSPRNLHLAAGHFGIFAQIYIFCAAGCAYQVFFFANRYYICIRIDIRHIYPLAKGKVQPPALTDGIERIPLVLPDNISLLVHKLSAFYPLFKTVYAIFQKAAIIVIGYKANFVRIRLTRYFIQIEFFCQLPDFGFFKITQRKFRTRQVLLLNPPQRVGLIFFRVQSAGNNMTSVLFTHPGIVTRSNKIAAQVVGPSQQGGPFDVGITQYARVRRAPAHIILNKTVDNPVAKFITDIYDKMLESMFYGNLPGVVHRFERAAARFFIRLPAHARIVPRFHGNSDHIIYLLFEHDRINGRINPAAHGYQYSSFATHGLLLLIRNLCKTHLSTDFFLFTKTKSSNRSLYCGFVFVQALKS